MPTSPSVDSLRPASGTAPEPRMHHQHHHNNHHHHRQQQQEDNTTEQQQRSPMYGGEEAASTSSYHTPTPSSPSYHHQRNNNDNKYHHHHPDNHHQHHETSSTPTKQRTSASPLPMTTSSNISTTSTTTTASDHHHHQQHMYKDHHHSSSSRGVSHHLSPQSDASSPAEHDHRSGVTAAIVKKSASASAAMGKKRDYEQRLEDKAAEAHQHQHQAEVEKVVSARRQYNKSDNEYATDDNASVHRSSLEKVAPSSVKDGKHVDVEDRGAGYGVRNNGGGNGRYFRHEYSSSPTTTTSVAAHQFADKLPYSSSAASATQQRTPSHSRNLGYKTMYSMREPPSSQHTRHYGRGPQQRYVQYYRKGYCSDTESYDAAYIDNMSRYGGDDSNDSKKLNRRIADSRFNMSFEDNMSWSREKARRRNSESKTNRNLRNTEMMSSSDLFHRYDRSASDISKDYYGSAPRAWKANSAQQTPQHSGSGVDDTDGGGGLYGLSNRNVSDEQPQSEYSYLRSRRTSESSSYYTAQHHNSPRSTKKTYGSMSGYYESLPRRRSSPQSEHNSYTSMGRKLYDRQKINKPVAGRPLAKRNPSLSSSDEEEILPESTPECSSCEEEAAANNKSKQRQATHYNVRHKPVSTSRSSELVTWQPSSDGKFLIGRMMLDRFANSHNTNSNQSGATDGSQPQQQTENILGLKVVGGKRTESGRLGAFVIKVKRGSVADTTGHLKRGDEVIMWNKSCLQGATYDQVCDAILASKADRLVELVVSRPIEDTPRIPATRRHQLINQSSSSSFDSQKREDDSSLCMIPQQGVIRNSHKSMSRESMVNPTMSSHKSPTSVSSLASMSKKCCECCDFTTPLPPGRLQVRLSYEVDTEQLYVTIMRASDLTLRQGIFKRNPYVKMYLLPDRSEASKRRTKTEKKTLSPHWNQSFVYAPIRRGDLGSMSLELSLWDLDRSVETNNHFIGESIVDLGLAPLDDRPQWFDLLPIGGELQLHRSAQQQTTVPTDYSCNSTPSRSHRSSPHDPHDGSRLVRSRASSSNVTVGNRNNSSSANFNPRQSTEFHVRNLKNSSLLCTSSSGSIAPSRTEKQQTDDENKTHRRKLPITPSHKSVSNMMDYGSDANSGRINMSRPKNRSDRDIKSLYQQQEKTTARTVSSPHVTSQSRSRMMRRGESCWEFEDNKQQQQQIVTNQQVVDPTPDQIEPIIKKVDCHETEAMRKSISLSTNFLHSEDHLKERSNPKNLNQPPPPRHYRSGGATHVKNGGGGGGEKPPPPPQQCPSSPSNKLFALTNLTKRSKSSGQLVASDLKITRIRGSDSASGSFASLASEESTMGRMINDFIGVIGPGQIAGRDTVTARSLGDIQLGVSERNSRLEVRIGRTKNLSPRPYARNVPAPYVKVYLMSGVKCLAKKKTKSAGRTIDPVFNQILTFDSKHSANNLQITVWGDYGRLDHKSFMGCVQIDLNSFDLSRPHMEWYRLFQTSSLIDGSSLGGSTIESFQQSGSITSGDSDQQLSYK